LAISEKTATFFPATASYSNTFERRAICNYQTTVTLKIETIPGEYRTTTKLIGRTLRAGSPAKRHDNHQYW
jgi:hypothetical protein